MKKITLFIFTCLCLGSAFTQSRIDSLQAKENDSLGFIIPDTGNSRIVEINRLLSTAESQMGTPYRYAGKKPGGFDCSGFVMYCYQHSLGITLSPSATTYFKHGVKVRKESARPGDVICFTGSNAYNRSIGHVGIITEVTPTEIYFIHSALHGGIRCDVLSSNYYKTRFLQIRRILQ
jgi:cell wall-associated NlpC family hydrolase